jgi:hypothetical protein
MNCPGRRPERSSASCCASYSTPETGAECLPTLGFSALMLRPGEEDTDVLATTVRAKLRWTNRSTEIPVYLFKIGIYESFPA